MFSALAVANQKEFELLTNHRKPEHIIGESGLLIRRWSFAIRS